MLSAAYFSLVLGLSFSLAYGDNFKCDYNKICEYGNQHGSSFSSIIKSCFELAPVSVNLLGVVTITVNSLTLQLPQAHYYWAPGNYDFYYFWGGDIDIDLYVGNIKHASVTGFLHITVPVHAKIAESPQGYSFISGAATVYPRGSLNINLLGLINVDTSVSKCALHFELLAVFNQLIGKACGQWIEEMNKNKDQAGLCSFTPV